MIGRRYEALGAGPKTGGARRFGVWVMVLMVRVGEGQQSQSVR